MAKIQNINQTLKKLSLTLLLSFLPLLFSMQLMAQAEVDPFSDSSGSTEADPFSDSSGSDEFSDSDDENSDAFSDTDEDSADEAPSLEWTGFLEIEQGGHIGDKSVVDKKWILSNRRFRLATNPSNDMGSAFIKADFIEDSVTGESKIDLREARVVMTPAEQIDLSIGKQVNTWGVADMLFINDLFPKNWISNFLGRDMESMKDSANSFRMTGYLGEVTMDLVYHPEFAPDTTPTGCRLSVYNPNSQSLIANESSCGDNSNRFNQPDSDSSETAIRLKVQLGSYEIATYYYDGFFKNPKGLQWADSNGKGTGETDLATAGYTMLTAYYPRLTVQGASLEGQLGPGIVALETGLYDSEEDKDGDNSLIENSKWKYLMGYRMDLSANLSAGLQWYQEQMLQYDAYEKSVQYSDYRKKEKHNTYTMRLTIKAQQETLFINLFTYQRPEDKDAFTKIDVSKRLNDNLEVVAGANIFEGQEHYEDREFGMLRDNDNVFVRMKYNF